MRENYTIEDSNILNRYIHGGKGEILLTAPSGKSHCYRFSKPNDCYEFPDDVIFVYAIHTDTQKDKISNFYVGMIEQGYFRLTRSSRFGAHNEIVKGAKFIVDLSRNQNMFDRTPMNLSHTGKCALCGRKLSSEKALKLGYGRRCLKYVADRQGTVPET